MLAHSHRQSLSPCSVKAWVPCRLRRAGGRQRGGCCRRQWGGGLRGPRQPSGARKGTGAAARGASQAAEPRPVPLPGETTSPPTPHTARPGQPRQGLSPEAVPSPARPPGGPWGGRSVVAEAQRPLQGDVTRPAPHHSSTPSPIYREVCRLSSHASL